MTAATLGRYCRNAAVGLILVGLMVAQFLALERAGMVLAIFGIACYGAHLAALYLHWEHGQ